MDQTIISRPRIEVRGGELETPKGSAVSIGPTACIVGRHESCAILLSDDRRVSGLHAELVATNLGVRVRDLGSKNGTFVDGTRITEVYLTRPVTLQCGDSLMAFSPGEPERHRLPALEAFGPLVGTSASMRTLFVTLGDVAPTELTVLITGETGTGKELVARAVHDASARRDGPFIILDCSAIPASLAESHLFGHERGAFTGAVNKRVSPFVAAKGGTLFIDEIGELPIELQPKLLRVLENRTVQSVGSNTPQSVDARLVAATRRDVRRGANEGWFRDDLFFRIAQEHVVLPALRDRKDDLPALIRSIAQSMGKEKALGRATSESLEVLSRYDWPGNVRELRNVITYALELDKGGPVDLARRLRTKSTDVKVNDRETLAAATTRCEREYLARVYEHAGANVSEVARVAGIDRKTAGKRLRSYGILKAGTRSKP